MLCGFLGAGKTTMMKHILETKHEDKDFRCAIIVNDMADFLRADAQQRGVEIDTQTAAHLPVIALDARQVRQALLNIVHNAVAAVEATLSKILYHWRTACPNTACSTRRRRSGLNSTGVCSTAWKSLERAVYGSRASYWPLRSPGK